MRTIIVALCASLAIQACSGDSVPVRRSEATIRTWILARTPLGSSPEQVKTLIAQQHWFQNDERRGKPPFPNYPRIRGSHIISALLPSYWGFPWRNTVDAQWSFDSDDKLIDVLVEKGKDAI
jgi:hypothetical protein